MFQKMQSFKENCSLKLRESNRCVKNFSYCWWTDICHCCSVFQWSRREHCSSITRKSWQHADFEDIFAACSRVSSLHCLLCWKDQSSNTSVTLKLSDYVYTEDNRNPQAPLAPFRLLVQRGQLWPTSLIPIGLDRGLKCLCGTSIWLLNYKYAH